MSTETLVGLGASIFTGVALLPQLAKLVKEKHANGISPLMLGSLFIGVSFWVWYGFLKDDWIIILSNTFSLAVNSAIVILSLKYRQQAAHTNP